MYRFKRFLTFVTLGFALLFFSPPGMALVYGLNTWPLSPVLSLFFSRGATFFQLLGWGLSLLGLPAALTCCFCEILPRRHWWIYSLGCVWMWSFFFVRSPLRFFRPMRRAGLEKSVERLQILPLALENFRRANGKYPARLRELTPDYLAEIPATGMIAFPDLRYRRGDAKNRLPRYELRIQTSAGFLNFDALYYRPNGYEDLKSAGEVERIGDWAYLHE